MDPPLLLDEIPISPRLSRGGGGDGTVPDCSAVEVVEREEVGGRCLRLLRSVRRGEALLVEEPLFLSPQDDDELELLLAQTCDAAAVAAARMAPPSSARSATAAWGGASASGSPGPTTASWLPASSQLCLATAKTLAYEPESAKCEGLWDLAGDPLRWEASAAWLWGLLHQDLQDRLGRDNFNKLFAIVATNAHAGSTGRAGLYHLGSFAEHSCAPSSYKEVLDQDVASNSARLAAAAVVGSPSGSGSPACRFELHPVTRLQLVVRALRDLDEGEFVSISYIEEHLPTWKRRELLLNGYGFTCACDRCEHLPEVVCCFLCPSCRDGPCVAAVPILDQGFNGSLFRCENCGYTVSEDVVRAFAMAESEDVDSEIAQRLLHSFHYKKFHKFLYNTDRIHPVERLKVLEQLTDAQFRLTPHDANPLLGHLNELSAKALLEVGDHHRAAHMFGRAADLYADSHRGPPDSGHEQRCYDMKMQITSHRLGPVPRRLSVASNAIVRSPSLPRLAEEEEAAES